MDLSDTELNAIKRYLCDHATTPNTELEFRFGIRDPASGVIRPGVLEQVFDSILNMHLKHAAGFYHQESWDVCVCALHQRIIIPAQRPGAPTERHQKTRLSHNDFWEYPVRISLSKEEPATYADQQAVFGGPGVNLQASAIARRRHRHSFHISQSCRLDLTEVQEIKEYFANRFLPLLAIGAPSAVQGALELPFDAPEWTSLPSVRRFEVELEISISPQGTVPSTDEVVHILTQLVKYCNMSHFPTKDTEIMQAREELAKCFRSGVFIGGAQPRTLHRGNYHEFATAGSYAVSPKLDGVRHYVFVDSALKVYMVRPSHVSDLPWLFIQIHQLQGQGLDRWRHLLVDCEMMTLLWAFDVFLQQGKVCGKAFAERQQLLQEFLDILPPRTLVMKPQFLAATVETAVRQALDWSLAQERHAGEGARVATDGLIFTPANEGYPTRRYASTLFKWKQVNTIDLKVNEKHRLCASIGQGSSVDIPFRPTTDLDASGRFSFANSNCSTGPLSVGSVWEFAWDPLYKSWTAMKLRREKTRGNNMSVALDNFQSALNSISESVLVGDEYDPALMVPPPNSVAAPPSAVSSRGRPSKGKKPPPRVDVYYITAEESQTLFGTPTPPSVDEQQRMAGFGGWKQNRIVAQLLPTFEGSGGVPRGVSWADSVDSQSQL